MIAVTSLKLSKKLHEMFPTWDDTYLIYSTWQGQSLSRVIPRSIRSERNNENNPEKIYPAYDLAYLLDKLPRYIPTYKNGTNVPADDYQLHIVADFRDTWTAQYSGLSDLPLYIEHADNPTEAAGLLCLELGKKELLK